MRYLETKIPGVMVIEAEPIRDERGFFARICCLEEMAGQGLTFSLAQANLSGNHRRGTLRGLHYQLAPHAEDKLVRAVRGAIFDVAVDLRPGSASYGGWVGAELTADNRRSLFVPRGCAHGYLTLADETETMYLSSAPYHGPAERGLRWDDPFAAVKWPFEPQVISPKDRAWPNYDPGKSE